MVRRSVIVWVGVILIRPTAISDSRQRERKSSSESSEKCLLDDGVIHVCRWSV